MRLFYILVLLFSFNLSAEDNFKEMLENYLQFNKARAEHLITTKKDIVGVELIIADQANNLASRFGHALLRFVNKDGMWANDAVVSFAALSEEETYSIWKGIFGGYSILPQVMNLHEYWTQYTKTEKRDLKRYILNLNPEQLDRFLDVTFDYILHPEKLDNYTFMKNNCVGVLTKFLIEANITITNRQAVIPSNVHKWLKKNELTVFPEFIMKNPANLEEKLSKLNLNKLNSEELVNNFDDLELAYIYLNQPDLSFSHFKFISNYLVKKNTDINDAFSFTSISLDLYDRCNSLDCFRKFNLAEKNMKVKDQLEIISYRLNEDSDLQRLYLNHRDFQKWDLVKLEKLSIINKKFSLTRKADKVFFKARARQKGSNHTQQVNIALQFKVKDNKVFLLDKEVGKIENKELIFKNNYKLLLHDLEGNQVLTLIKV